MFMYAGVAALAAAISVDLLSAAFAARQRNIGGA
jgi:hypothetical protein